MIITFTVPVLLVQFTWLTISSNRTTWRKQQLCLVYRVQLLPQNMHFFQHATEMVKTPLEKDHKFFKFCSHSMLCVAPYTQALLWVSVYCPLQLIRCSFCAYTVRIQQRLHLTDDCSQDWKEFLCLNLAIVYYLETGSQVDLTSFIEFGKINYVKQGVPGLCNLWLPTFQ